MEGEQGGRRLTDDVRCDAPGASCFVAPGFDERFAADADVVLDWAVLLEQRVSHSPVATRCFGLAVVVPFGTQSGPIDTFPDPLVSANLPTLHSKRGFILQVAFLYLGSGPSSLPSSVQASHSSFQLSGTPHPSYLRSTGTRISQHQQRPTPSTTSNQHEKT